MRARAVFSVLIFLSSIALARAIFHHKPRPEEESSESADDYRPSDPYSRHPSYPHHHPYEYPHSYPGYYPSPYPRPYRKPYCHWRKPHRRPRMCGRRFCPKGTRCFFKKVPCFHHPCPRVPKCVPRKWSPHMRPHRWSPYLG
ncbi:hypothetical protein V5799_016661 [Amblyomma americanum]|uniref:Uncharacterized protein n=1 Tax=Amblyomma americanum TaxID=6943 RepID=A0AAQ4F5Q7_AMBAM